MIEFVELLKDNQDITDNLYLYEFAGTEYPYYTPHGNDLSYIFNYSSQALYYGAPWDQSLSDYWINIWSNFGRSRV